MTKLLPAIYEHGIFKPIRPFSSLTLPEHQQVFLTITISKDEIPSVLISKLAEESKSLRFLNTPEEDIYNLSDGEEV